MPDVKGGAPSGRGRLRVFGRNMLAGPLLDTDEAQTVVMCDDAGEPCVILARMADNRWAMDTNREADWQAFKARYGVE